MSGYRYAADVPECANFEAEFMNRWLPFLYSRSRLAGLSLAGLRGWMDANGMGPCAADVEQRMEWGNALVKGGPELPSLIEREPAFSAGCHPARHSVAQQVQAFRRHVGAGEWRPAEEAVMEAVAGEQNVDRLCRMCHSLMSVYAAPDRVLEYLEWCLAERAELWRFVLAHRIAILQSQRRQAEAERELGRLAQAYDAALAANPDDVSLRLSKVGQLRYFGGEKWAERLAVDVGRLAGIAVQDPALAARIRRAVDSCRVRVNPRDGKD
jgi:hypothetical protein